jgi:hypothetical protein
MSICRGYLQWEKYWNLEQIFLVEKSPHSFLKIPLLRRLFRNALSVKFIVLLKVTPWHGSASTTFYSMPGR